MRLATRLAAEGVPGGWSNPVQRDQVVRLWCEEQSARMDEPACRARTVRAGRSPGPESSIGKVHQGELNQRIQLLAVDMLGAAATAWSTEAQDAPTEPGEWAATLPYEVRGMLRSRANTIEGGTTEVNKNILGERVLGLPREPDPLQGGPWRDVPRS